MSFRLLSLFSVSERKGETSQLSKAPPRHCLSFYIFPPSQAGGGCSRTLVTASQYPDGPCTNDLTLCSGTWYLSCSPPMGITRNTDTPCPFNSLLHLHTPMFELHQPDSGSRERLERGTSELSIRPCLRLGCFNKVPQPGQLINSRNLFWRLEVQDQGASRTAGEPISESKSSHCTAPAPGGAGSSLEFLL